MPSTAKQAETIAYENARDALAAQIKALTDAVARLVASEENKVPNASGTGRKKGRYESRCPQISTFWPSAKNVAVVQHDHPTWKGKTALTT
jgi:hypothetical protein